MSTCRDDGTVLSILSGLESRSLPLDLTHRIFLPRTFRPWTFQPRTFRPCKMLKADVSAITINLCTFECMNLVGSMLMCVGGCM